MREMTKRNIFILAGVIVIIIVLSGFRLMRENSALDLDDPCAVALREQAEYLRQEKYTDQFTFKAYPAPALYTGPLAMVGTSSDPTARMFRTKLNEELTKTGVNFAGHYSIVSVGMTGWGDNFWIIDRSNGRTYPFPYKATYLDFAPDSELIVMDSKDHILESIKEQEQDDYHNACAYMGPRRLAELRPLYFRWRSADEKLELLAGSHPPENTFWRDFFGS